MEKSLDISWKTILKVSLGVVFFYILYNIRDILIWFIFALIISVLFNPAIDFLQKKKIPRILATVFVYLAIFGIFSILIYAVMPIFSKEVTDFIKNFPEYFKKISPPLRGMGFEAFNSLESFLSVFSLTLDKMTDNIFNILVAFFGGVFSTAFVIVTAVFLSLEEKMAEKIIILVAPKKYEASVLTIWNRCQKKVSGWFAVRILTSVFVGVASYLTFFLFNVKYPFTLALFAGVFNFVPYLGSLLAGILLFFLILPMGIIKTIFVLAAFIVIQQIESHVFTPILMKKFVGVPAVLVLISMVVGAKLWGFLGAVLAIPLFGILFEFIKEFLEKKKGRELKEAAAQ